MIFLLNLGLVIDVNKVDVALGDGFGRGFIQLGLSVGR